MAEQAGLASASWLLPGCSAELQVLNAAFGLLLHRYTDTEQVLWFERSGDRCRPIQTQLTGDTSWSDLVEQLCAQLARPAGIDLSDAGNKVVTTSVESSSPLPGNVILDCSFELAGQHRLLRIRYDRAHYAAGFIDRLLVNFEELLASAAADPDGPARLLGLISPAERELLLARNATSAPYQSESGIHQLVQAQVQRTPDAVAVSWGRRSLSYRQLNERANRLARALLASGVEPGDRIGLSLTRSDELVCLVLATLKAGCAYVPLDPAYPAARLRDFAAVAGLTLVLTEDQDWATGIATLAPRGLGLVADGCDGADLELAVSAGTASHLIFTSGSTGRPKGVVVSHRNVAALLGWAGHTYRDDEISAVLFATSLNFDLSVFELWCPLTRGGQVLVADNALALTEDSGLLPTLVNTVPSALNVLLQRGAIPTSVRVINVAGEPLAKELVNAALEVASIERVFNLYGPSEDTTYSTAREFTGPITAEPTIGHPIDNTQVFVLDSAGQLVPKGVIGELYLGGAGLAGGYLGDPVRTAAAFVDAPLDAGGAQRLYRTGDLVCWDENDELAFIGRRDSQVKIRGHRIELGEIAVTAQELPGIDLVAVVVCDGALVCYLQSGDPEVVAAHLATRLPAYMQPARILIEPDFPLLPNGKVDRNALAARPVDWRDAGIGNRPLTALEREVTEVWADILGAGDLSADHDFFSIGGHSLLANVLAARLNEHFGLRLLVADVYTHRTPASQAALVEGLRTVSDGASRPAALSSVLAKSAAAHRVPGVAAVFQRHGEQEIAWYGKDDLDSDRDRTRSTRQRVTCVNKVLLAYVALMLVDQGRLGLDEGLSRYLPEAVIRRGGRSVEISLRQLLSHTTGIDDSYEGWHDLPTTDLDGYVRSFARYEQLFEPGEVFAYSACGTSMVALLVQRITGRPWWLAVNELLLRPLGIESIPESAAAAAEQDRVTATGHLLTLDGAGYQPFTPSPQTIADQAPSWFAVRFTIEELAALAAFALADGLTPAGHRLLPAELAREMRTPQVAIPGHHFMHAWGLGWLLFAPDSFGFISNGSGHQNFIQIFPEQGITLSMQANSYPAFGMYEDLVWSMTGRRLVRTGQPAEFSPAMLSGRYAADGYRLEVFTAESRLHYRFDERDRDGSWVERDRGGLVWSGAGGFTSDSPRQVLAGSISFFGAEPEAGTAGYVRIGQRLARRQASGGPA